MFYCTEINELFLAHDLILCTFVKVDIMIPNHKMLSLIDYKIFDDKQTFSYILKGYNL
jgi:hypothetical protein